MRSQAVPDALLRAPEAPPRASAEAPPSPPPPGHRGARMRSQAVPDALLRAPEAPPRAPAEVPAPGSALPRVPRRPAVPRPQARPGGAGATVATSWRSFYRRSTSSVERAGIEGGQTAVPATRAGRVKQLGGMRGD